MKFTRDSVVTLSLPAGKSDHFEWDESLPGFGVRLRQGGSLTWVIQYRFGPPSPVPERDSQIVAGGRKAGAELDGPV